MKKLKILPIILLLSFGTAIAQPGFIDRSFGENGKILLNLGETEQVYDAIKTKSNQLVICGTYTDYADINSSFVARFSENGTLDNIFGLAGKIILSYPNRKISAVCMDRQSDGKYIICGSTRINDQSSIFMCRLDTNGNLDKNFGNSGWVFYTNDTTLLVDPEIIVLDNDEIVVGASTLRSWHGLDMVLLQFSKNGVLDESRGNTGLRFLDIQKGSDEITNFAKSKDGSFYVVGYSYHGNEPLSVAFKFKANGDQDLSYGNNGLSLVQSSGSYAAAVDDQNRLYMAGNRKVNDFNVLTLYRLMPDGKIDNNFGQNGTATMKFLYEYPIAYSILFNEDGRITLGGYLRTKNDEDAMICRFLSSGYPDSSFSYDGYVTANLTHRKEFIRIILPQSNGNVMLVGSSLNYPDPGDILLASYQTKFGLWSHSELGDQLNIYPNPGTGLFHVSMDQPIKKVRILNAAGMMVDEVEGHSTEKMDMSIDREAGLYWIEVETEDGMILRKKVVKI